MRHYSHEIAGFWHPVLPNHDMHIGRLGVRGLGYDMRIGKSGSGVQFRVEVLRFRVCGGCC